MLSLALVIAAATALPRAAPAVPAPPGELRGQVTQADGAPVARFTVNGVRFEDREGRFKVLTPPEGEFRVVVRSDGFAPNLFHVQGASGKKLSVPEISLGDGEHVVGEVVDPDGAPVVGARVTLADPSKIERLRFVRPERVAEVGVTGRGGWFELRRVPRGLLVLVVRHPEYLPEFVRVNTRQRLPVVTLHRGGGVVGTVRDTRGAPVPGARVVALSTGSADGGEVHADVRGRFELRRLRPGSYQVAAFVVGAAVETNGVEVSDGEAAEISLQLRGRRPIELRTIELGVAAPPAGRVASR
jgi:hypothetical protein